MQYTKLTRSVLILMLLVLIVVILVYAKPFLVPLTFAAILSMLLLPITKWLEKRKVLKALATVASILVFIIVCAAIVWFVSKQVADLASDSTKIEQQFTQKFDQLKGYISKTMGIPTEKQEQLIKEQQSSSSGGISSMITGIVSGFGTFLTNFLLVLVYIFLFIYFRSHLKEFIIRLVPNGVEGDASKVIHNTQMVSQKYLTGLALMIACLWVMYGIGFSIIGVKNAIFFAILCGLLEIIPFVGNLTGTALTLGFSLVQGGDTNTLIGILVTYALVQFIQTYILEPLVVGHEVSINPLFTIVGIVAGEMVWGIPGMILAIPLMGMAKIVFDNIESLKPYGYLIGEEEHKKKPRRKKIQIFKTAKPVKS